MVKKPVEVEATPPPAPPPKPKLKERMSDTELQEWEAYFEMHDKDSGAHRPDLALMAGIGLMLLENVKRK